MHVSVRIEHETEHWECSVDRCVTQHEEAIVNRNSNEIEQDYEDSLDDRDDEATVEDELGKDCRSTVGQAPVPQY